MKNNLKLLLILFLLLPLLNCRRRDSGPTEPEIYNYLTYEDKDMGIKISYPYVFEKQENSDATNKFVKFIYKSPPNLSFYLIVTVSDLAPGMSIEQYNDKRKKILDLEFILSDYSDNLTLADNKAYAIESTCFPLMLKMKSQWTFKNNKVYEITYISKIFVDFLYMNHITRIINSFEIIE